MNNETSSILTDRWGFTWASTKTGIQRFNGYVMENINPVVDHDTILIDYSVTFFPLQNGNFWISYAHGILEFDPLTNIFKRIISLPASKKGFLPVMPLLQKGTCIWCMYSKKGIIIYDEKKQVSQPFGKAEIAFVDSILESGPYLYTRVNATNGNDIFLSNTNRLLRINTITQQLNYIPNYFLNIIGLECNEHNIYLTTDKALLSVDIQTGNIKKSIAYNTINNESVFSAEVYLSAKNQLLVSIGRRLYEFDTACNYQKEFTTLSGDPFVNTGQIHLIYTDNFKRIWLITNDDIKLIENVEIPFSHFIYPSLNRNFVKCIYYDENKHLVLVGCFNGGVLLYDTSGNPLWEKPLATDIVKDIMIIEKLSEDNYLLETYYRGWFIMNLETKKITPFPVPVSIDTILHPNTINWANNHQRVNDSIVFVATKGNVYRCVFKSTSIISAHPLLPALSNTKEQVDCFVYSSNKTLWAGYGDGTVYVLSDKGNLQKIIPPGSYSIRSCTEDIMHNIWIGTEKGLYAYNTSAQLIKKVTKESGLLNDCIYALLPLDDKAGVFASNNFGLSYVPLEGSLKNYTKEVGLQDNEFNNGAACKTKDGKFYFGGVNGVSSFYPAALSIIKDTPVINLTKLVVNDSVYNATSSTWNRDSILLPYYQNHIQLDIAANGLLSADEYIYTYRLKSLEDSWQTTRQPSAIRYTLEPGNYTLEINCSPYLSSNTVFSKKIVIIIHPPWWRTWWFRLLSSLFLGFIIALIVWQYNRREYMKKIRALEVQHEIQQERERISRDLHDNLGAHVAAIVANVSRIREPDTAIAARAVNELENNSQSIVTQLHDTIWALNREAIALTAISDRFKIFLQKIRPSYPAIDISVRESIEDDPDLSPANALHLFRIMQEAVNNAVRHSKCQTVVIYFESNSHWRVSIVDDGTGIGEIARSDPGNGLRNMRQRAKEAGWDIQWLDEKPNGTRLVITPAS